MKVFFYRFGILMFLVLLQLSFFDIVFPWFRVPLLLLSCVVVWTLVSGFPRSLWMTVPLTLLFEIFSSGVIGSFSLYAVLLAYVTSFLSRRLLVEHHEGNIGLYAIFSAGGALLYQGVIFFFLHSRTDVPDSGILHLPSEFSSGMLFLSLALVIPVFFFSYGIIRWFEDRVRAFSQRQFLNVR